MVQSKRGRGRPRNEDVASEIAAARADEDEVEIPDGPTGAGDFRLSPRRRLVLETIERAVVTNGYPPSMREIGEAAGLASLSSVAHQLSQLERLGYVRRDPKRPRAIEVVNPFEEEEAERAKYEELANNTVQVPVVGRIAAGGPILAEQEIDDVFSLPTQVVGSGEMFLLKVVGDSMIEAAICHDDWVVVRKAHTADNGQIVAALLDGEATVKTLKRKAGRQ